MNILNFLDEKSAGSVSLLVLLFHGIWHRRHFVERVTESLRRMIIHQKGLAKRHNPPWEIYHTRDIYRYFILDEVYETARFLKQPRIKRR